ncbi:MAG: DHH family phosphoesterase [Candidatus Saccharimonadales bacterium]
MNLKDTEKIKQLVEEAKNIIILQADNPDADSLGSALALEQILGDLGKQPYLYCGVDVPGYLKYLPGWDRVELELPRQFDLSIIVDASTMTLLDKLADAGGQSQIAAKPCLVLDHHGSVQNEIPFASIAINDPKFSSTGELIYNLAKKLAWPTSIAAQAFLMTAILGDTQGLANNLAGAETYQVMSQMVAAGVDRPQLEDARRELSKMAPEIFKYKAELIRRTEFYLSGKLAIVSIPQSEINQYSPLYNPAPLIQNDMLATDGVAIAVVLKNYDDGHTTAAIRCNSSAPIAAQLAEHFGGGGHLCAAGFKIQNGQSFDNLKSETIRCTGELLRVN